MKKICFFSVLAFGLLLISGCKTKADIKKEQELEKLKQEVSTVKGDKADYDQFREETRTDLARISSVLDEHAQYERQQREDIRKELGTLNSRVQSLEQKFAAQEEARAKEEAERSKEPPPPKTGLEAAKKLLEEGKLDDAIDALKPVAKSKGKSVEVRQAQFLLAETYFLMKDYSSAALEFSDYRKRFGNDSLVPNCVYRLANSFKAMGKNKEAKLFYQELLEKYPKSKFAAKAKVELKKIK